MDQLTPMLMALSQQIREVREGQIRTNEMLRSLLSKVDMMTSSPKSGRVSKLQPFMVPVLSAGARYGIGLLVIGYVLKGGDALTAATTLLQLLKHL